MPPHPPTLFVFLNPQLLLKSPLLHSRYKYLMAALMLGCCYRGDSGLQWDALNALFLH